MERHELWITDDTDGRYRILVLLGLIAIGTAFGYTIGLREGAALNRGSRGAVMSSPADAGAADGQSDADDRAGRDADPPAMASYYGSAVLAQRGRLRSWNAASPGRPIGEQQSPARTGED